MKRIVRCLGSSVINADAESQTPWADVWISWVNGQRGKREYFGPTLIGAYDLKGELVLSQELAAEYPKDRECARDVRNYERILDSFAKGKQFAIEQMKDKGCPTLYTAAEVIDRAEAEHMLAYFIKAKGVDEPVFKWVEPKILCGQVSFGHLAERTPEQTGCT